MKLRYGVLNFFALLIAFFLAFENYETWPGAVEAIPQGETTKKSGAKIEHPPLLGSQKEASSFQSYISFAEKNIFSPDRKEFPITSSPEVKKPSARPQIILYGVTIAEEYERASLANPGRSLYKGERETKSLKVGEKIGEYKLAKISPDRIMMEGTADSFEVLLYDPKMPKKRIEVKAEGKPAPTAGTQPAVAPPTRGSPAVTSPVTGSPVARSPVPTPPSASAEAAKPAQTVQERVATPPLTTRPGGRTSFPSLDFRRGRRTLSPPAETPTQATPAN